MPQANSLAEAMTAYDYPSVTFDFAEEREVGFTSMRELDDYLQSLLRSTDIAIVKDGLSGILYWGYYRVGYRDHRVHRFRARVTDEQLREAVETFQVLPGTGLKTLKALKLPEYSQMAFVTKLQTFLDPDNWCVLDSKIANFNPLAKRLKRQPTSIPITTQNDQAYAWWVDSCRSLASRVPIIPNARPVDVERGIFYLIDHGRLDLAERLLEQTL